MFNPLDYPFLILLLFLLTCRVAASVGAAFHAGQLDQGKRDHDDFTFILGGTLTLLGLIIGFSFSMAVNRYDQRKNYEAQEANAIGTEYVRADLLPPADGSKVRAQLTSYLGQRILCYKSRSDQQLRQINAQTALLQGELWSTVAKQAVTQPTPVAALVLSGMNDVLNSQGYTQAAWWNRIPIAAWFLLVAMAIFCNLLTGYGAQGRSKFLFLILPIVLSMSLFLIADIDSPRRGVIRVHPQNLESLAESLHSIENPLM
jgi:hypothetical protein